MLSDSSTALQLDHCMLEDTQGGLIVDISMERPPPLVPAAVTRVTFPIYHELAQE